MASENAWIQILFHCRFFFVLRKSTMFLWSYRAYNHPHLKFLFAIGTFQLVAGFWKASKGMLKKELVPHQSNSRKVKVIFISGVMVIHFLYTHTRTQTQMENGFEILV